MTFTEQQWIMVLGIRYLVWCVGFVYMPVENVVGEILRSRNAVADKHNDRNMLLLLETIEIENVGVGNKQTNMCKLRNANKQSVSYFADSGIQTWLAYPRPNTEPNNLFGFPSFRIVFCSLVLILFSSLFGTQGSGNQGTQ